METRSVESGGHVVGKRCTPTVKHQPKFTVTLHPCFWREILAQWNKACPNRLRNIIAILTCILGVVLLYYSAFHFIFWLFSPVFAIMAIVPLTVILQRPVWRLGWEHIGFYSSALFVYHPIIRTEILPRASQAAAQNDVVALMESVILFITFAYILARIDLALRTWWKQSRQSPPS